MHAAGLGDIAVPGLLACLALRYDASRAINMRARADAAAEALKGAFSQMDVSQEFLVCVSVNYNATCAPVCLPANQLAGTTPDSKLLIY